MTSWEEYANARLKFIAFLLSSHEEIMRHTAQLRKAPLDAGTAVAHNTLYASCLVMGGKQDSFMFRRPEQLALIEKLDLTGTILRRMFVEIDYAPDDLRAPQDEGEQNVLDTYHAFGRLLRESAGSKWHPLSLDLSATAAPP